MQDPTKPADETKLVRGWKAIADWLGMSRHRAYDYAMREKDPLPIYSDSRSVAVANTVALREWEMRQVLPFKLRIQHRRDNKHRRRQRARM